MKDNVQVILLLAILLLLLKMQLQNPKKELKNKKSKKVILDTCALIDGRIISLVQSGFVPDELIVPSFIVAELQMLADGSDAHKRERARYGLEVVKLLQDDSACTVILERTDFDTIRATDDKLVALAKKLNASLYTTDFNLNKVASIEGVQVLNVNELAQNMRPVALPGESVQIKLVQKGNNQGQAVGYLTDGTMVVVDNASKYINQTVTADVSRTFQTVAGKMIFAQLKVASQAQNTRIATPQSLRKPQSRRRFSTKKVQQ